MYPVPSRCALAFAGELSARHSRCWRFRGLQVHHCYDLLSCSPPLQETFTSGLSTVRSPSPLPDITTVATGQAPPAGLTPAGPTTSVAAQLPPLHSMTSSARASSDGGMVRPSAFAAFMLITSSNFVGCSIGKSAGLAPFAIRSTYSAARSYIPVMLGP